MKDTDSKQKKYADMYEDDLFWLNGIPIHHSFGNESGEFKNYHPQLMYTRYVIMIQFIPSFVFFLCDSQESISFILGLGMFSTMISYFSYLMFKYKAYPVPLSSFQALYSFSDYLMYYMLFGFGIIGYLSIWGLAVFECLKKFIFTE